MSLDQTVCEGNDLIIFERGLARLDNDLQIFMCVFLIHGAIDAQWIERSSQRNQ